MLAKIAWRNVWRSRGRSITIIIAVAIGVASISFLMGFINGFVDSFVEQGINHNYSHIQIHNPNFKQDKELKYFVENEKGIIQILEEKDTVYSFSERIIISSMISSSAGASGTMMYGIIPENEARTTGIDTLITEGEYFTNISRNPILISTKTAEKMKLKLRSKLVITFQNMDGEITAAAFRVSGIFDSPAAIVNEGIVYAKASDIQRILGDEVGVHEIAVLLNGIEMSQPFSKKLEAKFPDQTIETWNVLAPELELMQSQVWINLVVVLVIIMGALCFGIVNTMLMAVLERVRELGMLMAIGMKKTRVFAMVMIETLMMAAVGAPLGIVIGMGLDYYYGTYGMDLSNYSEGLKDLGYTTILYTNVNPSDYIIIALTMVFTALIAAIYPARKAIKLKPVEALHKI